MNEITVPSRAAVADQTGRPNGSGSAGRRLWTQRPSGTRRRLAGGLGALALLAAGLSACSSSTHSSTSSATTATGSSATTATGSSATAAPTTSGPAVPLNLEIYLGSFYTWLPYVASAEGFFAKNGIDAHVIGITSGGPVAFAALANGSADVAMGDLSLAGPLLEKGVGLTLISGAIKGGWQLIAPKGSAAPTTFPASVQYLKGKPVGVVSLGSSSYYFLQQTAVSAGIGTSGVSYTALGGLPADAISALDANRVAAAMVSPDLGYYLVNYLGGKLLFNTSSTSQLQAAGGLLGTLAGNAGSGMWARNGWLSAHPGVAAKFQLAMDEADVWMKNPANLTKLIATLQAEKDLASFEEGAGAAKFFSYALPLIVASEPGGETGSATVMSFWVKVGLLSHTIPVAQWYSPSIPTTEAQVASAAAAAGVS
ncbi:MAG: ABC transporter substrate-binding protein [Acidimicrobiales bacterium]